MIFCQLLLIKNQKDERLGSGRNGGIIKLALEHGVKPNVGGKNAAIVPIAHEETPNHGTELFEGEILKFPISGVKEFLLHPFS